jgi:hypothetical protein
MKPTKHNPRRFLDLSPEEREREVSRFDKPTSIAADTRPLTQAERALFERMRGSRGAADAQRFNVDPSLLRRAAAYARRNHMTVSQVVERGLRRELAVSD